MKKLLLVVVLAVASLANAAILSEMKIVDQGAGLFGIELVNGMANTVDGSGGYWIIIGVDPASGVLSAPAALDMAAIYGDASGSGLFAEGLGVVGEFTASTTSAWSATGGVYAGGFVATTSVIQLYAVDDAVTEATLVDTFIIPEPATMVILALGGLLIRKK